MYLKIEFLWLMLVLIVVTVFPIKAQLLENSSFEGPAGIATVPPGWQACGEASTPDTQSGDWGVDSPPSDGKTYLGMVCRGEGGVLLPNCEGIQQKLKKNIIAGRCYFLKMDLAYSSTMINNYGKPIKLIVYAGSSSCGYEEKLWE
jgi:hypothetical protein